MTMTITRAESLDRAVSWQGVNHLALITTDMDKTVRFWHDVLEMPLVATLRTESFRHYFFKVSESCTIAFFDYAQGQTREFRKPAGVFDPQACQFDHLSFDLPDLEALENLRARLVDTGCEVTEVIDHGLMQSIYFSDPNGIALEATFWTNDPTTANREFGDPEMFADDQPVQAVLDIQAGRPLNPQPTTLTP